MFASSKLRMTGVLEDGQEEHVAPPDMHYRYCAQSSPWGWEPSRRPCCSCLCTHFRWSWLSRCSPERVGRWGIPSDSRNCDQGGVSKRDGDFFCEEGTAPCLAACEALAWVELKSRHAELDGGHGLDAARQGLVIDALLPEKRGGEHIDIQGDGCGSAEGYLTDTSCSRAHCRKSRHLRTCVDLSKYAFFLLSAPMRSNARPPSLRPGPCSACDSGQG